MRKLAVFIWLVTLVTASGQPNRGGGVTGGSGSATPIVPGETLPPVNGAAITNLTGDGSKLVNSYQLGDGLWNVNLSMTPRINQRLQSGLPLRLLFLRDDAIKTESYVADSLARWMPQNGSSFGGFTADYYQSASGSYTYTPANGGNAVWPGSYITMGNASEVSNVNGTGQSWPTDTIEFRWFRENGFGTLSIQTQTVAGAWGVVQVVSGNNGGAREAAYTNFTIPRIANGLVKVVSTGNNMIVGMGAYDSTSGAGFTFSLIGGGDIGIEGWLNTAAKSNYMRIFLLANTIDGIVFTDSSSSNSAYLGTRLWDSFTRENGILTDLIYGTPSPVSGVDSNTAYIQRFGNINGALEYARPCIDYQGLFLPIATAEAAGLLTAGNVHLPTAGNNLAGALATEALGFTDETLASYGYAQRPTFTDVTLRGLTTLTNINNNLRVGGNIDATSYFLSRGSLAGYNAEFRDATANQWVMYATANRIAIAASTISYRDYFYISNQVGTVYFSTDPFLGIVNMGKSNHRWRFWGTNSNFEGFNTMTNITSTLRVDGSVTLGSTLQFPSGSNQRAGNATLVGGTVTVANTSVTANTVIQLQRKTAGGTIGDLTYTLSAATSFTINSASGTDTSVVSYMLIEVP